MTDDNVQPEGEQPESAAPSPEGGEELAQQVPRDAGDDPFDVSSEVTGATPTAEVTDTAEATDTAEGDELTVTRMELEERTLDLQRLQAEFLNYKRRVERDRELIRENATYAVLTPIIEVLDTIDRAREHEPLEGGFKATAEQLERVVSGLGLVKFGEPGDAFDPTVHEALSHIGTDAEVEVTTCKVIAKAGYKIGDRVVRAAQVLVVDPVEG